MKHGEMTTVLVLAGSLGFAAPICPADDCKVFAEPGKETFVLNTGVTTNLGGISAAFNRIDDEFMVSWFDSRISGQNDTYAQRLGTDGTLLGENIEVAIASDSTTDTSIAHAATDNVYLITWRFQGGSPGSPGFNNAFGRIVDHEGNLVNKIQHISTAAFESSIVFNEGTGEFLHHARAFGSGDTGIHGRRVGTDGDPIGAQILIGTLGAAAPAGEVAVNTDTDEYLSLWRDQVDGRLIGQRLTDNAATVDDPFEISDVFPGTGVAGSAAFDPASDRYLVIHSGFSGDTALYGRFVSAAGEPIDDLFTLFGSGTSQPRVEYDPVHEIFLVVWRNPNSGAIEAQLLSLDADPLGDVLILDAGNTLGGPRLAVDTNDGGYLVAWRDTSQAPTQHDVHARFVHIVDDCPSIPGDLNGDGSVGVPDLLILINAWGTCADCDDCPADLTGDCTVGVPDLLILINNWG